MTEGRETAVSAWSLASAIRRYVRRAFCVALAILLAVPAGRDAARTWNLTQPVNVRPPSGSDPLLRLHWMETRYGTVEDFRTHAAEIRLASRHALSDSPLNAMAMRLLGILSSLEGEDGGGLEFLLAEQISRRDLPTQFVQIDRAALADDLPGTLAHYDRALLVHNRAVGRLFPVLAQAISDAGIRAALHRYAGRRWFADFLLSPESNDADPLSLVALHVELRGKLSAAGVQPAIARLLARLIDGEEYSSARDLLRTIPHVPPEAFDTIGFSEATADPRIAPLSWAIRNDEAVETEIREGAIFVRVAPERSALVAERTTILTPGRYVLAQQVRYETEAPPARLDWLVTCAAGAASPILEAAVASGVPPTEQKSRIIVPGDCRAQKWQLRAAGGLAQMPSAARIAGLTLTKE